MAKRKLTTEDVALAQTIYGSDLAAISKFLKISVAEVKSLMPKKEEEKPKAAKTSYDDGLTDQQRKFVLEYLVDLNGTKAATRAGYSEKTAQEQSSRLLSNVIVRTEVERRQRIMAARTEVSAERVIREFARIAFADMRTFVNWDADSVNLKDSEDLDSDDTACVAEVSQTISKDGGSIKFKLHSKTDALTQLGRHLGLFVDKVEHDFTGLTDDQRIDAVGALLDRARARQAGRVTETPSE